VDEFLVSGFGGQEMLNVPSGQLMLKRSEVMTLSDRVLNIEVGTATMPCNVYPLLEKLGSVLLELTEPGVDENREVPIVVTLSEAWHLRSHVFTNDKYGSDPLFGVNLLRKIYAVIFRLNSGADVFPTNDHAVGLSREQVDHEIRDWRSASDSEPNE
jgi:hypothetical protein